MATLDLCYLMLRSFTMPMIGQPAPQFVAPAVVDGGDFKDINLADYKGKYVVLFFYPLDFTFVCPTEITQFRDSLKDFKAEGAEVLGCSIDSVHSHKRWIKDDLGNLGSVHSHKRWIKDDLGNLGYPLIGDVTKRVSRDFGVLLEDKGIAT